MSDISLAPMCAKHGAEKVWQVRKTGKGQWICKECERERARNHYRNASPERKQVVKARAVAWNRANPEVNKRARDAWRAVRENWEQELSLAKWRKRQQKYGLTRDQFMGILKQQDFCCAICGKLLDSTKQAHVDHCHATGDVRGLLCTNCNTGIGLFKDDSIRLQKAIDYLNGGNRDLVSSVLHRVNESDGDGGVSDSSADANTGVFRKGA